MGEQGLYPPYTLTLLHERLREGLEPTTEEREALRLPYPPLPDLIRDYQSRRPEEFKAKFLASFELKQIVDYRRLFSYSKLLDEAVSKWTLSGFGNSQEEKDYVAGRRGYRFARLGAYATAAAAVVGFNLNPAAIYSRALLLIQTIFASSNAFFLSLTASAGKRSRTNALNFCA